MSSITSARRPMAVFTSAMRPFTSASRWFTSPKRAFVEHVPTPSVATTAPAATRIEIRSAQDMPRRYHVERGTRAGEWLAKACQRYVARRACQGL